MIILNELLTKLPNSSYRILNPVNKIEKVSEIMVMASPDVNNWIISNELILTSLYGLSVTQKKQLIIDLKSNHASGLMIKRNDYLKKIPDELILLSKQLNLPLIEIHDIKYREIISTFEQLKKEAVASKEMFIDQYWNQILKKLVQDGINITDEKRLFYKLQLEQNDSLKFITLRNSDISLKLFKYIAQVINVHCHSAILGFLKGEFYILIKEKQLKYLKKELLKIPNSVFISGRSFSLKDIRYAINELTNIRKLTNVLNLSGNFISYENLGINKLFIDLPTNTLMQCLLTAKIQKLWKENPVLCKSLKAYLDANLNITKAAKNLFIHPKSLTYRLHKIESLLNLNLKNTNEIVNLSICLNLHYLQQGGFFIN